MGLAPVPLSRSTVRAQPGPGLLLGFANIAAETAAREAARLAVTLDG
jgi:hypothetical protein